MDGEVEQLPSEFPELGAELQPPEPGLDPLFDFPDVGAKEVENLQQRTLH